MQALNEAEVISRGTETLRQIIALLNQQQSIRLDELSSEHTALVVVDMVNGFAKEGALQSPRIYNLIPGITSLASRCILAGIPILAFADCHSNASSEFESYPVHCLAGSSESEVVDEIKAVGEYTLVPKNSTNGFLADVFQSWLRSNPPIDTFIVTGDCTDICIQQIANTLKSCFNQMDKKSRIIVPMDLVDTFDLDLHNADLMNIIALFNMMGNGVEVVSSVI